MATCLGEMALLDGKERSANATAASECELLMVPRRSFLRLLKHRPEVCINLMIVLSERRRRTNEQVEEFAFLSLAKRMAKLLLRLARDEMQQSSSRLGLKISQRALGGSSVGHGKASTSNFRTGKRQESSRLRAA